MPTVQRFSLRRGMREFHAKCVKISRRRRVERKGSCGFPEKYAVASALLKDFQKQADNEVELREVRELFAEQIETNRERYEEIQQEDCGVYFD